MEKRYRYPNWEALEKITAQDSSKRFQVIKDKEKLSSYHKLEEIKKI